MTPRRSTSVTRPQKIPSRRSTRVPSPKSWSRHPCRRARRQLRRRPHPPSPHPRKAAPAKPRRAPATRAATDGGIQRYGEAVVREVLGATFIEETEAPPARTGFGERG